MNDKVKNHYYKKIELHYIFEKQTPVDALYMRPPRCVNERKSRGVMRL